MLLEEIEIPEVPEDVINSLKTWTARNDTSILLFQMMKLQMNISYDEMIEQIQWLKTQDLT
jgi:hypothetical protein